MGALLWIIANPVRALRVVAHVLDVVESVLSSPLAHELRSLVKGHGLPPQGGAA